MYTCPTHLSRKNIQKYYYFKSKHRPTLTESEDSSFLYNQSNFGYNITLKQTIFMTAQEPAYLFTDQKIYSHAKQNCI